MKNYTKYYIFLLNIFLPAISWAENIVINIPPPSSKATNIMTIIKTLVSDVVMPIGAVVVVIYIIYAGFTFVTAQGNPGEIDKAKKRLMWSLVGAAVLLGAVAISSALCTTLKSVLDNNGICA